MTPGQISKRIVTERLASIDTMLTRIRALPLQHRQAFRADPRNVAAAESYLRRALEALLDLGRHILAKGLGYGVSEYRQIAAKLCELDVLAEREGNLLAQMAGYRNRWCISTTRSMRTSYSRSAPGNWVTWSRSLRHSDAGFAHILSK